MSDLPKEVTWCLCGNECFDPGAVPAKCPSCDKDLSQSKSVRLTNGDEKGRMVSVTRFDIKGVVKKDGTRIGDTTGMTPPA